ncbi:capsular polysaccharide biosynthesis protein [Agrobacterium larrymoorei]|uniref:Capsular polysaccharide biosynthesis protein n=1 Tax=Agrobacterium larrymoorei TaxID=160699 RepID=A0ABX8T7H4_9HYPH|nr:capsular polysaccharide biosynthesis protein [Agrobacterium larrymoorei]QYA08670.1 capsular polysaccharide biosynthesis protein [Agrobacterium larrymoorei]
MVQACGDRRRVIEDRLWEDGIVVAFHIKSWKRQFFRTYFPRKRFYFAPLHLSKREFLRRILPCLSDRQKPVVFVWGNNLPDFVSDAIDRLGIDTYHVEDGFVRSLKSHAGYSLPISLTLDRQRPYFDSRGPSDLEDLLRNHNFDADPALITRAREGIETFLKMRITKYNDRSGVAAELSASETGSRRKILVIGQVEDDASIQYGSEKVRTNNELIEIAAAENPGAEILYKPHPDVLSGVRREISCPDDLAYLCTILRAHAPLPDVLESADHVYTITSLAGFEALLRGKKVTTVGAPFYSGWGLTDDRQQIARRDRKLSIEEIFAGAYILYPFYYQTNAELCSMEQAFKDVSTLTPDHYALQPQHTRWKLSGTYGLLGWRRLLTPLLSKIIEMVATEEDARLYRLDPAAFFHELSEKKYRVLAHVLYPRANVTVEARPWLDL